MSDDVSNLLDSILQVSERLRILEEKLGERFWGNDVIAPAYAAPNGTAHFDSNLHQLYGNYDGTALGWELIGGGGFVAPHNLLNGSEHPDTVAQAVSRGSLVCGDATPDWNELIHPGATDRLLRSDANDVSWHSSVLTIPSTGGITFAAATTLNILTVTDNIADALSVEDTGGAEYLRIVSTNTNPLLMLSPTGGTVDVTAPGAGADSERLGNGATAAGKESIAIGYQAQAGATRDISIGTLATSTGGGLGVHIGYNATSGANERSVAIGYQANCNKQCVAIGYSSVSGQFGAGVGYDVTAGTRCVSIGNTASTSGSIRSIAIGEATAVSSDYAIGIGYSFTVATTQVCVIGQQYDGTYYVDLGIGINPPTAKLHFVDTDTATNTVVDIFVGGGYSSNAVANGFGSGYRYDLKSSTTAQTEAARLNVIWIDSTHATRSAAQVFSCYSNASLLEFLRLAGSSASTPEVVVNDGGVAMNTRIEGLNDTYAFYVDANSDRIGIGESSPSMKVDIEETVTLGAAAADAYSAAIQLNPDYATGGFNITRHNYLDMNDPSLAGGGTLTDACVIRFDAAAGTHAAVDAGTTKTTPTAVNAWVKVNINGTVYYMPAYTSKTA